MSLRVRRIARAIAAALPDIDVREVSIAAMLAPRSRHSRAGIEVCETEEHAILTAWAPGERGAEEVAHRLTRAASSLPIETGSSAAPAPVRLQMHRQELLFDDSGARAGTRLIFRLISAPTHISAPA